MFFKVLDLSNASVSNYKSQKGGNNKKKKTLKKKKGKPTTQIKILAVVFDSSILMTHVAFKVTVYFIKRLLH